MGQLTVLSVRNGQSVQMSITEGNSGLSAVNDLATGTVYNVVPFIITYNVLWFP